MQTKIPSASKVSVLLCGLLTLLVAEGALGADPYIIFDSIPPDLRATVGGATINGFLYYGPYYPPYNMFASEFTPAADGTLTTIDLNLWQATGLNITARIDVSLRLEGTDGKPSDNILTSGTITVTDDSLHPQLTSFVTPDQVWLSANRPYWLVLAPHDAISFAAWTYSSAVAGFVAESETPDPASEDWHRAFLAGGPPGSFGLPEFRVSAVPEPSIFPISLIALALLVHRTLRRGLTRPGE
jgi:hypothetical protein